MIVAVGSKNPVKIEAVKEAFEIYFPKVKILCFELDSGVSSMPYGDKEIIKGAINRAKKARDLGKADYGVGIEGGYKKVHKQGYFESPWFAIMDKKGNVGLSGGGGFMLPDLIIDELKKGKELGEVMDKVSGISNSKQKDGAIGFFTKGIINRKLYYKNYIIMALIKFINKETYG